MESNPTVAGHRRRGGMALKALSQAHPLWQFVDMDPSQPMLDLAAETLGPLAERDIFLTTRCRTP